MASEAVNRILFAEAEMNRKNTEARQRRDELINDAMGRSSRTIQKKLGEANAESGKLRAEYDKKLEKYRAEAKADCLKQLESIRAASEKNMDRAVDRIIEEFF